MRSLIAGAVLLVASTTAHTPALAQCGPGGCTPGRMLPLFPAPVRTPAIVPAPPAPAAPPCCNRPNCDCGCRAGGLCRCAEPDKDGWRWDSAGRFWWRYKPAEPAQKAAEPAATVNFGVETERLAAGPRYRLNGAQVSRDRAYDLVEKGVVDRSSLRKLVVIGPERERQEALRRLGNPAWAEVTDWAPDDWRVKERGFVTTGAPTVYLLEPDGRVLHRQDDLEKIEQLAVRGDPKYDPSKDPDLRKGGGSLPGGLETRSLALGGVVGGALALLLRALGPALLAWLARLLPRHQQTIAPADLALILAEIKRLKGAENA